MNFLCWPETSPDFRSEGPWPEDAPETEDVACILFIVRDHPSGGTTATDQKDVLTTFYQKRCPRTILTFSQPKRFGT